MKFLKKASLAAAIAATPFAAQAELVALDDATMSSTTGQAGVTIEIDLDSAGITIGSVEYTDEGSVVLENIKIADTDITQTIDVVTDGSLVIDMSTSSNLIIEAGDGVVAGTSALALKSAAGAQTEIVNDLSVEVEIAKNETTIVNLANAANIATYGLTQSFDNGQGVVSLAAGGSAAIVADMDVRLVDLSVGAFGYTAAQATTKAAGAATAYNAFSGAVSTAGGDVYVITDANGNSTNLDEIKGFQTAATFDADSSGDISAAEQTAMEEYIASASAIGINNVSFHDGSNGTVNVKQTIWAGNNGVYIAMGNINGTLEVGGIELGGTSIGSLAVSDINLNGMTQRIYGH